MPRVKPHHHPCAGCGAKTECPGTWEENYDGMPEVICREYHVYVPFTCHVCAALHPCDDCGKYRETTVVDADRLCAVCRTERHVAAASDLLAALKAMVASYDGIREMLTSPVVLDKLARADAAIARAEGRQAAAMEVKS